MGKIRTYNKDLQETIMELRYKENVSIAAISEQFGIPEATIYGWCHRYETYKDEAFVGSGHLRKADAVFAKLKKENERLKQENEILKKLAAYQAKQKAEGK